MDTLYNLLKFLLDVIWIIVISNIIMSWLVAFQVLNIRQPLVNQVYYWLTKILDPVYKPLRRVIPPMGGLDLAPLVVIVGIIVARGLLNSSIGLFG